MQGWGLFLVILLPLVVETAVIVHRPTWLTWLPRWKIAERGFVLAAPRVVERAADYRGTAAQPGVADLPERIEIEDGVLVARDDRVALRRPLRFGRGWLMRIDIVRAGDEIVMTARQVVVPITAPLVWVALGVLGGGSGLGPIGFPVLMLTLECLRIALSRKRRRAAAHRALARLEEELRDELENRASAIAV